MKKVIRIYFNVWGWYKNKAMAQKLIQIIPPIHLRVGRKNIHSARCFRMSLIDYWSHSISKWWWKTNWSKFLKLMTELLYPSFFFSKSRLLTNWVPGAALRQYFSKIFSSTIDLLFWLTNFLWQPLSLRLTVKRDLISLHTIFIMFWSFVRTLKDFKTAF